MADEVKKLESLSPEQLQILEDCYQEGLRQGLVTTPCTLEQVKPIIMNVYEKLLDRKKPKEVFLMRSPLEAWNKVVELAYGPNPSQKPSFIWPYLDGHWSSYYFAWVKAYKLLGIKDLPLDLLSVYESTVIMDVIYPLEEACVVSNNPTKIKCRENRLHCDNGAAVQYADGFEVYALNGVRVPKVIVETPLSAVDKKWLQEHFVRQQNAEIRREVVRRVTPTVICSTLGCRTIDTLELPPEQGGKYELVLLEVGGDRNAKEPFLKMVNPSVGTVHFEGVPPTITKVIDAIAWRNGIEKEQIDMKDGARIVQQGDLVFFPKGAKKINPIPLKVT